MRRALLLIAVLGVVALAEPLAAQTQQQIQKAANDAIRQLDLQLELPRERQSRSGWQITLPPELLLVAAVFVIGFLIYSFRDMIPIWRFGMAGGWGDGARDAAGALAPVPDEEVRMAADELARQGRFVEAMHVLLLQGLIDIRRHLGEQFADSLTSREILRSTRLSDQGRAALRDIIARVEWSYFGEHPAELADYAACRTSFDSLTQTLHGDRNA